ncbi:T9SS type A sorting domain-containing protein, partial [Crocinitomix sp.]|nr:T9SS type A sorting domain-containing protein [Crocinitomix sp.]
PGGVESLVPTVLDNTIWDYVNQLMCESSGITAETKDKIQIYPNPSTGVFSIVNDSNETGNYIIYNQLGEVIFSGACLHGTNQIDMTTATSGIYECVIVVDGIFETKRLIIQ